MGPKGTGIKVPTDNHGYYEKLPGSSGPPGPPILLTGDPGGPDFLGMEGEGVRIKQVTKKELVS